MSDQYLMHYGVKGMKWGVRHDYVPTGRGRSSSSTPSNANSSKNRGQSVVDRWNGKKKTDKRKVVRNALLGAAAISAATVVGLELYKFGKMSADRTLKAGTLVQSVAVKEKTDFGKSFYVAASQDDRRKILKNFTGVLSTQAKDAGLSGEVYANMFLNDKSVNIAGRKAMRKAYKSVYGTNKGFYKFARDFNQFDQAKRAPFMNELQKRGYSGFLDQAGMQKWWGGMTPMVLNGSQSGFALRNRAKINTDRLSSIPVKDVGTKLRNVEERGLKVAKYSFAAGAGAQTYISLTNKRKNQNGGRNG